MWHAVARFSFAMSGILLIAALTGCCADKSSDGRWDRNRGGRDASGEESWASGRKKRLGEEYGVLTYADFGTKFGFGGRPVVEYEPVAVGRATVHIATARPGSTERPAEYRALVKTVLNPGDPNPDNKAVRLRPSVQPFYPFLRITDGQSYVVGDRPAAQTDHIMAGSESTIFLLEVEHNGQTDQDAWTHRLYVLKVTNNETVRCWAQERMDEEQTERGTVVAENSYAEVKLQDGRWQILTVATIPQTGPRRDYVNNMVAAAQGMGLPVP